MGSFNYSFPAIKGIQACDEYFICMIPLGLLVKLFPVDTDHVDPEFRAQRKLNLSRIPEIRDYILLNRSSYIFSALCASFDGEFCFAPIENNASSIGTLSINMDATFLINDGQHRRAAIVEALKEDPTLSNETIPVVMFLDRGLQRSQQMFTDLNKHAVNTTKSLNALYDSIDPLSVLTKHVVNAVPFLKKYTDKEKDNLGKYSGNLFTLNNILIANKNILRGFEANQENESFIIEYWSTVFDNILEFKELEARTLSKVDLREMYIVTQGVTINALGHLGNYFLVNKQTISLRTLSGLSAVNWRRNNLEDWLGAAIDKKGKIIKNTVSVTLTYLKIKQLLGLPLTKEEKTFQRKGK